MTPKTIKLEKHKFLENRKLQKASTPQPKDIQDLQRIVEFPNEGVELFSSIDKKIKINISNIVSSSRIPPLFLLKNSLDNHILVFLKVKGNILSWMV